MIPAHQLLVRPADRGDAAQLVGLLEQLGYPTAEDELRPRLDRLIAAPAAGVLVGEVDRRLVGLAAFHVFELVYRPRPECRLTALVVDSDLRRQGIARALVGAVEALARQRGCSRLELNTRQGRPDALPFYTSLGFVERRHRLVKALEEHDPDRLAPRREQRNASV